MVKNMSFFFRIKFFKINNFLILEKFTPLKTQQNSFVYQYKILMLYIIVFFLQFIKKIRTFAHLNFLNNRYVCNRRDSRATVQS